MHRSSRRPALLLAVLAALTLDASRPAEAALARGSAPSGGAQLLIAGAPVGNVRAASGGFAVGVVVSESTGPGGLAKKHLGGVQYEPLELEVDLSLERSFYDWINAAWKATPQPRSGSLVLLDQNRVARQSRDFQNAWVTETTLSACDASSKSPGSLTVALTAERISGSAPGKAAAPMSAKSKPWLASNFRLEIDGLETSRVSRVSPVHVTTTLAASGAGRERSLGAAKIEIDNLKIVLLESGAESWRKWHDDFLVQGNATDKNERSGRLVLLGPSLKDELAEVRLYNLGIVALRSVADDAAGQIEAELYVERAELAIEPGAK